MIPIYVEAYGEDNQQILGSLDGQMYYHGTWAGFKRTDHYKHLPVFKTLNNRVKFYRIVCLNGTILKTISSQLFQERRV